MERSYHLLTLDILVILYFSLVYTLEFFLIFSVFSFILMSSDTFHSNVELCHTISYIQQFFFSLYASFFSPCSKICCANNISLTCHIQWALIIKQFAWSKQDYNIGVDYNSTSKKFWQLFFLYELNTFKFHALTFLSIKKFVMGKHVTLQDLVQCYTFGINNSCLWSL